MDVLACVKSVPMVGDRIMVTGDGQDIDTRFLGFTVSPHEECAVEEAIRITEKHGGAVSVLTLGPESAVDQLRNALAMGAHQAVLVETCGAGDHDGREWGPVATAFAIAAAIRQHGPYDLMLFGNESADSGNYQVGVRVAHQLGLPVVTGVKSLEISGQIARVRREYRGTGEVFQLPLPAVITVKEGINLPRYPSLPGRLRAKKMQVARVPAVWREEGLSKRLLRVPATERRGAEVLGTGTDAVPKLVELLERLGIVT